MKHRRKVKGEQVITLQMAQQLKIKNVNVLNKNIFVENNKIEILFSNYYFPRLLRRWTLESKSKYVVRK